MWLFLVCGGVFCVECGEDCVEGALNVNGVMML